MGGHRADHRRRGIRYARAVAHCGQTACTDTGPASVNIPLSIWPILVVFIVLSSIGDVMMSKAMTIIGDLGVIRAQAGIFGAAKRVFTSGWFWLAISSMAGSFFTLLIALNRADLSFVG